jgi:hypothetical protein
MKRKKPVTLAQQYPQALLSPADVDDPYEPGAKLRVIKNVREHAISQLHSTGVITDDQRIAAELFRAKYEMSVLGASKAIDYTKERVDGGRLAEPLSERVQEAFQWLNSVARYPGIGKQGFSVLVAVCGEGKGLIETAKSWSGCHADGTRGHVYIKGRLIEALEELIKHSGMIAVGSNRRRI